MCDLVVTASRLTKQFSKDFEEPVNLIFSPSLLLSFWYLKGESEFYWSWVKRERERKIEKEEMCVGCLRITGVRINWGFTEGFMSGGTSAVVRQVGRHQ